MVWQDGDSPVPVELGREGRSWVVAAGRWGVIESSPAWKGPQGKAQGGASRPVTQPEGKGGGDILPGG